MSLDKADLQHRDWLLFSTKRLLQSVNYNISVRIKDTQNGGKLLIAQNISESDIDNLPFLVNTDQNNNYLYLQDFNDYTSGSFTPQNIPGLKEVVINSYTASDIDGFMKRNITHFPFMVSTFENTTFKGTDFSEFVDQYSGFQPFSSSTYGYVKTYEIVLNPDQEASPSDLPSTGGSGFTASASTK